MNSELGAILFVALASSLAGTCNGADASQAKIEDLMSSDPLKRQATLRTVQESRKQTIDALLGIASKPGCNKIFNGPLHYSIVLLGKLRACEAVKTLSRLLMFVPDGFETDEELPREYHFVAAVALVSIGNPAIDPMVSVITSVDDKEERNLAAWVLMQIDGKELAIRRLEYLAEKDVGAPKERLLAAKTHLENWKPFFGNPRNSHD